MESEVENSVSPASSNSCSPEIVGGACSPPVPPIAVSPYFLDSALPSDSDHNYDHHSSEEELEVINSHVNMHRHHHRKHSSSSCAQPAPALCDAAATPTAGASTNNTAPPAYPEKRKWSQVVTTPCETNNITTRVESSGSSDEEVQGLMAAMATPVEFRTSPPLDAHKPGHKSVRSLSPPPKLFHFSPTPAGAALEVSPRKRHHRGTPRAHHIQRPCLDFEKMQQVSLIKYYYYYIMVVHVYYYYHLLYNNRILMINKSRSIKFVNL